MNGGHLWSAAHSFALNVPALSAFYMSEFLSSDVPQSVREQACGRCGRIWLHPEWIKKGTLIGRRCTCGAITQSKEKPTSEISQSIHAAQSASQASKARRKQRRETLEKSLQKEAPLSLMSLMKPA